MNKDFERPNRIRAHTWAFDIFHEKLLKSDSYGHMAIHTHYRRIIAGLGLVLWGSASILTLDGTKLFPITYYYLENSLSLPPIHRWPQP